MGSVVRAVLGSLKGTDTTDETRHVVTPGPICPETGMRKCSNCTHVANPNVTGAYYEVTHTEQVDGRDVFVMKPIPVYLHLYKNNKGLNPPGNPRVAFASLYNNVERADMEVHFEAVQKHDEKKEKYTTILSRAALVEPDMFTDDDPKNLYSPLPLHSIVLSHLSPWFRAQADAAQNDGEDMPDKVILEFQDIPAIVMRTYVFWLYNNFRLPDNLCDDFLWQVYAHARDTFEDKDLEQQAFESLSSSVNRETIYSRVGESFENECEPLRRLCAKYLKSNFDAEHLKANFVGSLDFRVFREVLEDKDVGTPEQRFMSGMKRLAAYSKYHVPFDKRDYQRSENLASDQQLHNKLMAQCERIVALLPWEDVTEDFLDGLDVSQVQNLAPFLRKVVEEGRKKREACKE